ncbi:hypothetical protein PUNSTDRAFT_100908 [Punctularia strigosozonata HHB-11173 SS5]|uniref:uncharacterized protein n=1 Tax=Punctularia strigosozonata (strain HHB-11173) TaxID=741275 RepID=UPI0004417592|nr:uncharacterized protein PUNSTDRAFT_100908 [Punctularia strigosozonata HHB-11173 SS5]EIN10985.1 hypothetical protein PUNSTDRAFT_100908 [Punctularia strigosozonata HHB-11173 SS5]
MSSSRGNARTKRNEASVSSRQSSDCIDPDPANTITDRLNAALSSGGDGYKLSLCPSAQYIITAPIKFASPNQEISTSGYPTGDERATLVVDGAVENGSGHTTAVDGTCSTCGGVKLRNIQINGTRLGAPPTNGGANIEFGGDNSGQLIEYVRSYDPRSWSCLHLAEGTFQCNNATVQHNDIGPCGSDAFQQWADGISVSCRNSYIFNNTLANPTDGGIVLFGAPGTLVENNLIWVENQTLLGGINMVDFDPWSGDYTGTVVRNNTIMGGFATDTSDEDSETKGTNDEDVIIKIGIAIGPRTWFGNQYGDDQNKNGYVHDNKLSGAFGYGMAVSSANNFTVQDNVLTGNTSFIGSRGPNCSTTDSVPTPAAFVVQWNNTIATSLQSDFQSIQDADGLTCILPPDGGDYWPFGGNPSNSSSAGNPTSSGQSDPSTSSHGGSHAGRTAGIVVGVIAGIVAALLATYSIRRWAVRRRRVPNNQYFMTQRSSAYTHG